MPVPVPHVCISVCVGEGGARGLGLRNMSVCIYLKIALLLQVYVLENANNVRFVYLKKSITKN